MTKKKLCTDCGTAYPEDQFRCPLCGSSQWEPAPEDDETEAEIAELEAQINPRNSRPAPRRSDSSRKSRKKDKPRREVDDGMPKSLVIASTIMVFLAVAALSWHILAQWIPGLPTFGGSSQTETQPQPQKPDDSKPSENPVCETFNCQQTSLAFTSAGQTLPLTMNFKPETANPTFTFTSSNPAVATVDAKGVVTAVGEGTTTIRISCEPTYQSSKPEVEVVCKFGEPLLPELSQQKVEFTEAGQSETVTVKNLTDGQTVSWRTSDPDVAMVDESGKITANGAGSCTVTAQIDAQTLSVTVTVAEEGSAMGTVNTDGVRMRSEPSTDGEILANFVEGDQLVILGEEDGWYRVEYGDQIGYIRTDLMDTEE